MRSPNERLLFTPLGRAVLKGRLYGDRRSQDMVSELQDVGWNHGSQWHRKAPDVIVVFASGG
jgi:hypothetical protein